jgi:hypothetical protein
MFDADAIKLQIRAAFADVEFPGDWCLRGSNEGEEPFLLEQAFKGMSDWRLLDPAFLDLAPDGYGSALSFFSDEAFRFYLPAYLIADIDGQLDRNHPVFHLTHGFTDGDKRERINQRRYGERTWFDARAHTFAMFDEKQVRAIVAYLRFKRENDEYGRPLIDQALKSYWLGRVPALPESPKSYNRD